MTLLTLAAAVISWGASNATLHACPDADACVTVRNELSKSPDHVDAVLELDGLQIVVQVVMGAGNAPDVVTVIAPMGYRVEPPTATIDEGAMVRFRVFYPLMG
jgi:hypothetical protein